MSKGLLFITMHSSLFVFNLIILLSDVTAPLLNSKCDYWPIGIIVAMFSFYKRKLFLFHVLHLVNYMIL